MLLVLAGLLVSMTSDWLSTSPRSGLALAAVIFAAIYVAAAGIIIDIAYTFVHGCLHSSSSPFQSTASRLVETIGSRLSRLFESIKTSHIPATVSHGTSARHSGDFDRVNKEEIQTFYDSVQTTHDDDSLNLAAVALSSAINDNIVLLSHSLREVVLSDNTIKTMHYLLSSEASIRANVTAAVSIGNVYGTLICPSSVTEIQRILILCTYIRDVFICTCSQDDQADLVRALMSAAEWCSVTTTGSWHSSLLWNSHFSKAMVYILIVDQYWPRYNFTKTNHSTMTLLLVDYRGQDIALRAMLTRSALEVIGSRLRSALPLSASASDEDVDDISWDLACDAMLASFAPMISTQNQTGFERIVQAFMSSTFMSRFAQYIIVLLVRRFSRIMGVKFVILAMESTPHDIEGLLKGTRAVVSTPDTLGQLATFEASPDTEQDSQLFMAGILRLVASIQNIMAPAHPDHFSKAYTYMFPCCEDDDDHPEPKRNCDFFCHYFCSIIRLLNRIRTLAVSLPFPDIEALGITWEELARTLAPATEDVLSHTVLREELDVDYITTIAHRNEVKAGILEAFRPFFMSAPQP